PIETAESLAFEKLLLCLILFVVGVIGCPSARNGRELHRDPRLVKHRERVSDLSKKETSLTVVRPDDLCIDDYKRNMLGHGVAPTLAVKRLVNMARSCDPTFTADILT